VNNRFKVTDTRRYVPFPITNRDWRPSKVFENFPSSARRSTRVCAVNWLNRGDFSNVNLWSRFNDLVESSFRIVSLPASRSTYTDTDGIMDSRSTRLPNHRQPAVFMSPKMPEAVFLYGSSRNLALRDDMIQNRTKYAATRRFCRRLHVKSSCRKKIPRAIHTMQHSGEKLWHAKLVIGPSAVISVSYEPYLWSGTRSLRFSPC